MGIPDPERDAQFYEGVPARRLVAFLIDTVFIGIIWIIGFIFGAIVAVLTLGLATPILIFIGFFVGLAYRWIMLSQRSATLGMLLTGIEVRNAEGEKVDNTQAFLHSLLYWMTLWFFPLMIIGWILMATSPHRRLLHDTMLGTVVINRPA